MLTQLLESSPRRRPRHYTILFSIVGHAIALSGAVVAAHPPMEPDNPERVITWHPPPPPPQPCTRCEAASARGTRGEGRAPMSALPSEPTAVFNVDVLDDVELGDEGVVIPAHEWRRGITSERSGEPEARGERAIVDREVIPHSSNPAPRYPAELRSTNIEGRVDARFVVDTTGRVIMGSVTVDASTHPAFSRAVVEALRQARFTPAESRGRRVPQLVTQPFVFLLRDAR